MVSIICHIQIPTPIYCHPDGKIKTRRSSVPINEGRTARTRKCCHHSIRCDLSDSVVSRICHIQIPASVNGYAGRVCKSRRSSVPILRAPAPRPRDRCNTSHRRDLPDSMVDEIRYIHIPATIHGYFLRDFKCRRCSIPIRRAPAPRPRDRRHTCHRRDFSDSVVVLIPHIHIPASIHSYSRGVSKTRRSAVTIRKAPISRTRQCRYFCIRRDLPDSVVVSIRHIHIPDSVHGYSIGIIKTRRGAIPIRKACITRTRQSCNDYTATRISTCTCSQWGSANDARCGIQSESSRQHTTVF